MPKGLWVLLTALWLPFAALAAPTEPALARFEARLLTAAEKRLMQAALAATGDYAGGIDGTWGAASQAAIEGYAAREFADVPLNAHAATLVRAFSEEVEANGWQFLHDQNLGLSLALPTAALAPEQPEAGGRRWWSRQGTLSVLLHRFDAARAAAWHRAAVAANARPEALAVRRGPDALLTAGLLADGRSFFARSDRVGGHWATVHLTAGPGEATAMALIGASIEAGPPRPWRLPAGGRLARIVAETAALLGTDAAAPQAAPQRRDAGAAGATGTGFFVGARTLVTAEHVVGDCGGVALADGTALALVAADAELDVAVLLAAAPAAAWLALAPERGVRLGQRLHAAGYPYYSIAGTSLHLTGGNVSALAGVDDDRRFFSFTAPVQPGNSGGPLIGADGRVLGVAVARLSESFIAEATGSLPQNVNYALAGPELATFLARHGLVPADGGLGFDLDAGAPAVFEAAVVPVVCR